MNGFSMILTQLFQIVLQPTILCAVLFNVTGLKGLSIQTLKKQERTECSWGHNIYNAKFSVETC